MQPGSAIFTHEPIEAENGVAAGGHPRSAAAAVRMLQAGGNAVDALTAAAFTSFVVEPSWCGIGGYGHISIYLAEGDRFVTVDAYGRAPGKAHERMFEPESGEATYYGHPFTKGRQADKGILAPSVPGAVAGFGHAQRSFGKLAWKDVLAPAIEAAEEGVPFHFHDRLIIATEILGHDVLPETLAVLMPDGKVPLGGRDAPTKLDTAALAKTLKTIAAEGPEAFYRGPIAEAVGGFVASKGGILSAEDLAAYRIRQIAERPQNYRGRPYISCFDQVAYEILNILDRYDIAGFGPDSVAYRHVMAEALAVAFTDSMKHYGDPDFVDCPFTGLASPDFAAQRQGEISLDKALARPVTAGDPWPFNGGEPAARPLTADDSQARFKGTSQAAAADREGNMASVCMSLGSAWGSQVFVPEVGCFLNNAMQNFDPRPGLPNSIAPGKMPIFAAPAIAMAEEGRGLIAVSGSGGYRIETGVLHTLVNWLDHKMPLQRALDYPRIHSQGGPTHVDPRMGEALIEGLERLGHEIERQDATIGDFWPYARISAVAYDREKKCLTAAAGPSVETGVAGF